MITRRLTQWIRSNIPKDSGGGNRIGRRAPGGVSAFRLPTRSTPGPPARSCGPPDSSDLRPKKTVGPQDLAAYLESRGNTAEDVRRCYRILSMHQVLLEIGCGCGNIALAIAARNPDIGVIATDQYDFYFQDPGTSHYCRIALSWQNKQLTAQNAALDNLIILRGEVEMLRFVPDQSIDSMVMVNPEPRVGRAALDFIHARGLETKIKPGDRQIIVKPYSREMGVMACGGLEFDHGEDWSRGLGFLFESPYSFTRADPVLWSVNINDLSPYAKNSTQANVYACKGLHDLTVNAAERARESHPARI